MHKERLKKIASQFREVKPEDNLVIWNQMLKNDPNLKDYCIRGKVDFKSNNGCLRDPVFFRFIDEPHQRTGTKYCLYPTYDFAIPIVDTIEGVTHALRSREYLDRNDLYDWILEKTGSKKIEIFEFSRLSMTNTILSKRNLKWFVDNNLVEGWDDPRFPTVQGILRRGMTAAALKEFMISQGPSEKETLMEWDVVYI